MVFFFFQISVYPHVQDRWYEKCSFLDVFTGHFEVRIVCQYVIMGFLSHFYPLYVGRSMCPTVCLGFMRFLCLFVSKKKVRQCCDVIRLLCTHSSENWPSIHFTTAHQSEQWVQLSFVTWQHSYASFWKQTTIKFHET